MNKADLYREAIGILDPNITSREETQEAQEIIAFKQWQRTPQTLKLLKHLKEKRDAIINQALASSRQVEQEKNIQLRLNEACVLNSVIALVEEGLYASKDN